MNAKLDFSRKIFVIFVVVVVILAGLKIKIKIWVLVSQVLDLMYGLLCEIFSLYALQDN